uniref:Copia protein n=1 Tax=Cajanus cajan TaxID=3821 RepID=A0A151R4X3_CAJCA|nr:Copia protein [Cajanus cajan]
MTGERCMFLDLKSKKGGQVTFSEGQKGQIMGIGKIGINSSISIDNVLYVEGLTRIESIRILLAFVTCTSMKLYQMNVKSTFLNGTISEEVYISQPLGFENDLLPSHVFKLNKALYGLKQAP